MRAFCVCLNIILLLLISACLPTPKTTRVYLGVLPSPSPELQSLSPLSPLHPSTLMPTATVSLPTVTPSPIPSPTPTIVPISTPTSVPPIRPVTAEQLPFISHDLLFINESGLVRWNYITSQLEVLVASGPWASYGGIQSFSVSFDGQRVVLEGRKTVDEYEVALLDLENGQLASLMLSELPGQFRGLSIFPDGAWVAYIVPGALPSGTAQHHLRLASHQARLIAGGYNYGLIYAVRTDAPDHRIEVGFCSEERSQREWRTCMGFRWSPDSRAILWSDARGVWLAELGQDAKLLVPHTIGISPTQASSTVELRTWSPLGRYLLVGIGHSGGWNWGVIDTEIGRAVELPDMLEGSRWGPQVTWMKDGRLFAVRPGDMRSGASPSGQIWRLESAGDFGLILEKAFLIDVAAENYPMAPTQLKDDLLAFALLNASTTNHEERGLYFVDLDELVPYKVNGLPLAGRIQDPVEDVDKNDFGVKINWAPDASGAIFQDQYQATVLYVPTDGSVLYDLRPVLGGWSCCYVWSR